MTNYGVQPTGFVRKPLSLILAELQDAMARIWGQGVIQTSQSPLGQLNGLMADAANVSWETAEDVYQSFDILSVEGPRQDIIAKLQRLVRAAGESDIAFRQRITNADTANVKLAYRIARLSEIEGVTFTWIRENSSDIVNDLGMPPHSAAYAVTGGDDEEVALAIYEMSIGGIGLVGNYHVPVVADGFCHTSIFIRPEEVAIRVELDVRHIPDGAQCAPPSVATLTDFVIAAFDGRASYKNGDTVTVDRIVAETAQYGNLKIVDCRIARVSDSLQLEEIEMTLYERAVIISPYVSIRYV